ncbi:MAG: hypothetical protein ACRDTV_18415 [Mycobacterium sp.]
MSHHDEHPEDGDQQSTKAPEVTDEHKEQAAEMAKSYDDQRPTAVLPGTDGTITGTAINEWLDDEGNPKFGKDKAQDDTSQDAGENG